MQNAASRKRWFSPLWNPQAIWMGNSLETFQGLKTWYKIYKFCLGYSGQRTYNQGQSTWLLCCRNWVIMWECIKESYGNRLKFRIKSLEINFFNFSPKYQFPEIYFPDFFPQNVHFSECQFSENCFPGIQSFECHFTKIDILNSQKYENNNFLRLKSQKAPKW